MSPSSTRSPPRGAFVHVASIPTHAAAGLSSFARRGDAARYLAVANYYGDSAVWAFGPDRRLKRVQQVPTVMAHDWETVALGGG